MIVDHVGQMIGRQTIGFHQHLHVDLFPGNLDFATQHVVDHTDTLGGYLHTHHMRLTRRHTSGHLGIAQMQAMPVITRRLLVAHLLGTQRVQALTAAKTAESMPLVDQCFAVLLINCTALALAVGPVRPTDIRAFIPIQPQPAQGVEDLLFGLGAGAHLIGIFDAQDELTTVLAGKAQVEQRNIGCADVGVTGWRRGNSGTDGHGISRARNRVQAGNRLTGRRLSPAWPAIISAVHARSPPRLANVFPDTRS